MRLSEDPIHMAFNYFIIAIENLAKNLDADYKIKSKFIVVSNLVSKILNSF